MLTEAEEESFTNYIAYSMKQGFPMTRAMVRFPNDPCYGEEACYLYYERRSSP